MAYRIEAIPMTFSDLQRHSPIASLFMWMFSYICAAFDNISTDSASRGPSAIAELPVYICTAMIRTHELVKASERRKCSSSTLLFRFVVVLSTSYARLCILHPSLCVFPSINRSIAT